MTNRKFTTVLSNTFNDHVAFRSHISSITAALSAMGLVQTSDTGQLDIATITVPGSYPAIAGYQIWRFNDALQTTSPIFIKIGYGRYSSTSVGGTYLIVEIGTGTNGASTITGVGSGSNITLVYVNSFSVTDSGSSRQHMISSDGSGLAWSGNYDTGASYSLKFFFSIDRFRDSSGVPNGDGLLVFSKPQVDSPAYTYTHDRVNNVVTTSRGGSLYPLLTPSVGSSSIQNSGAYPVSPIWFMAPGLGIYKTKMALVFNGYDLGLDGEVPINYMGAVRNFKSQGTYQPGMDSMGQAFTSILQWWND